MPSVGQGQRLGPAIEKLGNQHRIAAGEPRSLRSTTTCVSDPAGSLSSDYREFQRYIDSRYVSMHSHRCSDGRNVFTVYARPDLLPAYADPDDRPPLLPGWAWIKVRHPVSLPGQDKAPVVGAPQLCSTHAHTIRRGPKQERP